MRTLTGLLLLSATALGGVTEPAVEVRRTTATQALLVVTGFDRTQGCHFEVWPLSSPDTLVPAADPAQGGSADCLASGVVTGSTLIFSVGRTGVTLGADGLWHTQALAAETGYGYRVNVSGFSVTGKFRTRPIPFGRTSPPAFPEDGQGNVVWPTVDFGARGRPVVDPLTGNTLITLHRPQDITNSSGSLLVPSGGLTVCAPELVSTSDGKQGYHCVVGQYDAFNGQRGGGYGGLYWIEHTTDPDTVPDLRFYGLLTWPEGPYWNTGGCNNGQISPFSTSDPNVLYCLGMTNTTARPLLLKGQFTGHQTAVDQDRHAPASADLVSTVWTPMTDEGRSLTELLVEYDPRASAWTGFSSWLSFGVQNDKLVLGFANGQQGSLGWVVIFDPVRTGTEPGCLASVGGAYSGKPGCIVAARPPHSETALSAGRWGGDLHTVFDFGSGWISIASDIPAGLHDGWGQYQVTLPAGLPSTLNACPAQPGGNPVPSAQWPAGTRCTLVQISGEPVSGVLPESLGPVLPGDQACAAGTPLGECVRFLYATDATHWWVQRQWGYPGQGPAAGGAAAGTALTMVFNGYDLSGGLVGGGMWWNWANDPHASGVTTLIRDPDLGLAHYFFAENAAGGVTVNSGVSYSVRQGRIPNGFGQAVLPVTAWPTFHGRTGPVAPNFLQQHPSAPGAATNANDAGVFYDARSYAGAAAACGDTASVTPVSGDLRRVRWPDLNSNCVYQTYKLLPLLVNSGSHVLRDVSPRTLTGTTTDQYRFCVAWRSGDCQAGSQTGDLYVNIPGLTTTSCTSGYDGEQADLCITAQNSYLHAITQVKYQQPDATGQNGRMLTAAFSAPRTATQYWSAHPVPDGRWALVEAGPFAGFTHVMLARVPSVPPLDSTNGQDFLPMTVSLGTVPAGVDNVVIRFGYDPQFHCTSRNEACVVAAAGDPFYFEGDTYSGLPANTRSVTIPALPERFVYWQLVYRDAAGRVVQTSAVQVN